MEQTIQMKAMKRMTSKLVAAMMAFMSFAAVGDTSEFNGGIIEHSGAIVSSVGDELLLTFESSGTFSVPKTAKVKMLLVGGGGAGGTVGQDIVKGVAGGGGAGGVICHNMMLESGTYHVTVGQGGLKAQNASQSWVGDDGSPTAVGLGTPTNFIASVKGGGGGGSVKIGGEGTPGASGGGGSWFGEFLSGGQGTDGYGWNGGTPTDINIGAGGGGATSTGKADGTHGSGLENDITGTNVIYARGGRGGNRGEQNYDPEDGSGYGFGGDGAVNGFGGKGGDGVVIVRFIKMFDYTDVKTPVDGEQGYTFSTLWTNNTTKFGFDLTKASKELRDGLDAIEGITSVDCSMSGTNYVGVGQYKFTLYLKDEYRWEDGSTTPKTFNWRVNEPNVVGNITVEVKKTVDWFEGTNATIAIDIHSTPEKKVFVPRVLMLGSLCGAHGLSSDVVNAAINAVTKVGDIDWYFFSELNSKTVTSAFNGSLKKGQTRSGQIRVGNTNLESMEGNHGTLYEFYDQLSNIISEINRGTREDYDYIIFSFDRGLIASSFVGKHSNEATVVNWLKKFYDSNTVIWLVDKEVGSDEKLPSGLVQTPWAPSPVVWVSGSSYNYWTTLDNYVNRWGNDAQKRSPYGYVAYNAMLGLFDPYKYGTVSQTSYGADSTQVNNLNATQVARINRLMGTAIDNQVIYDNAKNVAEVIENVVKPTIATLEAHDQIYIQNGLKINGDLTDAYYTTNEAWKADSWDTATKKWTKLTSNELKYSDENGIEVAISNVTTEVWLKMKIGVSDTGKFLTSVDAKYNERTGKWEKDPNNGPVRVEMLPDNGRKVIAEDEASTTVEWSFEAFKITGEVIYGEGEFIINGFYTNLISVAKGYNPEVLFKGGPGWAVCYIEVDGQVLDEYAYKTNWFFGQISADHDIKVAFTNIVKEVPPPEVGPTTYVYDGNGHTIETLQPPSFIDGYEEYSNHWKMVYTTDPDADPNDRSAWSTVPPITNVVYDAEGNPAPQNVYARICLDQPGYEDGAIVPYWVGTNTVTILPREITIEYDDAIQTSNTRVNEFKYHVVDGNIVEGDDFNIESGKAGAGKCTNYPTKGNHTEDSITKGDNLDIVSSDGTIGNYIIKVKPGDYYYPDLDLVGTAPDVKHVYDGNEYGTEASVLFPVDAKTTPLHQTGTRNGTPITDQDFGTHKTPTLTSWSDYWYWTAPNGTTYYHTTSNETSTIATSVSTELTIEYLVDGKWTTTPPTFTDVGEYDVEYRINFTSNIVETTTRNVTIRGNTSTSNTRNIRDVYTTTYTDTKTTTINYNEYVGTAKVTITPRELTITADSDSKTYDGTPLTNPNYTVDGLVDGETITAHMTSDSSIVAIGSVANKIDHNISHNEKFNPDNYIIKFVDGTLTIVDIPNGGGSDDYLDESKALMIIDHDPCTNGYVYLAFRPQLTSTENVAFDVWVERTAANKGFKFKYGKTREECEACNPVAVELSMLDNHLDDLDNDKVWVKVPLENIENVASFTKSLEDGTAYVRLYIEGKADAWKYKYAEPQDVLLSTNGAISINMFGIQKVDSIYTNTLIAVPWTWYSETEEIAKDIPVKKLVKTTNLTEGDMVYAYAYEDNERYYCWTMHDDEWVPCDNVQIDFHEIGELQLTSEDSDYSEGYTNSMPIARGYGLWLCRKNPLKDGENVPFWVYGQSVLTDAISTIAPGSTTHPAYTIIGNPWNVEVRINDLEFNGEISKYDRLAIETSGAATMYLQHSMDERGWYFAEGVKKQLGNRTVITTVRNYDMKIQPGKAIWYRREDGGEMTIKWRK